MEPSVTQPPTVSAISCVGGDTPSPKSSVEKPLILSEGLPPVPHKLAARILCGEYMDMAELMRDNLEAQRRAGAASSSTPPTPRSRTYMAVVTSKFPHRIKELLAYQTLIVREARRCGGKGWLAYDAHFRQQVVGDESADWSRLNQSLYAVTLVTQGERETRRSCVLCLESYHAEEQCALYTPPTQVSRVFKEVHWRSHPLRIARCSCYSLWQRL